MSQKQLVLMKYCGVVIASLLLLSGCGEKKTKADKKAKISPKIDKSVKAVKTGKIKITNAVENPSFEKAEVFNTGLYKKGKNPVKRPIGWTTKNQILNDSDAWVSDQAHTGKHSLKIKNVGGTDAYWQGKPVVLKQEANSFETSVWTKAKQITKNTTKGRFQLVFAIYKKNASGREVYRKTVQVDIPKANHDWEKTSKKIFVGEKISRIVPYLYFSGTTGTVWFDDLSVIPYLDKGKTLFDSNNDKSLSGKIKVISAGKKQKIYEMTGSGGVVSNNFIPVDKNGLYELSGEFKSSGKEKSKLLFGYISYDKNKKMIRREYVNFIKSTETELAKECDIKDEIIYLKDAAAWKQGNNMYVAFKVDDSGKRSDLPNTKLSGKGIKRISKDGDLWKVELLKPCGVKYTQGTKVREHAAGATYNYLAGTDEMSVEWTKYNKRFSGREAYSGIKYLKVLLLNHSGRKDDLTEFKNIKLLKYKSDKK